MRLIYYKTINGVQYLANAATAPGDPGLRVKQMVGVGNQFWSWPSIPAGKVVGVDFAFGTGYSWGDGAPICSSDPAVNNAILAELATSGPSPAEVLTYE